ncbi:YqaA family protein [Carboxylicivirga marina]|uniref:DedA family protein n=2 Tax=Carboxylicivirga marina TaxID=2800988 RepID=A0ABS1HEJ0_9BACT|nr:DedA family protein [Carboxylicivirga marina]MBK3516041.1 DedA family protein [Carboxylicivirga marina]
MLFDSGYFALFLASFLAATVIPFSSEALLSGMLATNYNLYWCLGLATLGNWLGGMSSYGLGWLGKIQWIEKYLKIKHSQINKTQKRIKGKELWVAFFCWLPGVGDVIAVILGLLKVNIVWVSIGMFIGKLLRYIVWALITLEAINWFQ